MKPDVAGLPGDVPTAARTYRPDRQDFGGPELTPRPSSVDAPVAGVRPASSSPTTDFPLALTIWEASTMLRLDPRTIRAMVSSGELEGNRRGHAIRVSRSSVLEWLSGKRRVPRSKR